METKTMDNNRVTPEQMRILKQYVTYTGEKTKGPWTCNKCPLRNWGRPNRIVAHLLWIKGKGIRPCPGMNGTAEREELARRLGQNSQPEEIAIPMDEAYRGQALLEDNSDRVEETNAECSEMINTIHHEQSSQPESTQLFFLLGGMHERMGDPIYTPSQVVFDHMNDEDMHPSQDGPTINPSRAASSMDIEGQQQQQPEEEYDGLSNLVNIENTSSRAVSSDVCPNMEHNPNVPYLGIAGREGGALPDVGKRMQNAVSQEKGYKKRKCASGSGTSGSDLTEAEMPQLDASNSCSALCESIAVYEGNMRSLQNLEKSVGGTDLQPDNLEQNSTISLSDLIRTPSATPGASMMVPPELCTLPSQDQQRAYVPNTDDDGVQGTNAVGPEMNNTIIRELHKGREYVSALRRLLSDCSEMNNTVHRGQSSQPDNNGKSVDIVNELVEEIIKIYTQCHLLLVLEKEVRQMPNTVMMLGRERNSEMNRWLAYCANFEVDVNDLDLNVKIAKSAVKIRQLLEAKSLEQIQPLLKRIKELTKVGGILLEKGIILLNPIIRKDLLSWNLKSRSCGSDRLPHPCPPGFDSDLWNLYLAIDTDFALYKECMSLPDEEDRKELLACLESVMFDVRYHLPDASSDDDKGRYLKENFSIMKSEYDEKKEVVSFLTRVARVEEMEKEIRRESKKGVQMLGEKRSKEIKLWLAFAEIFKIDANELGINVEKAKSLEEIQLSPQQRPSLLESTEELMEVADILIEAGRKLLNPIVPKGLLSWNPNHLSCGSQLQDQMNPGHVPQQA